MIVIEEGLVTQTMTGAVKKEEPAMARVRAWGHTGKPGSFVQNLQAKNDSKGHAFLTELTGGICSTKATLQNLWVANALQRHPTRTCRWQMLHKPFYVNKC